MIRMNYGRLLAEVGDLPLAELQYRTVLKGIRHHEKAQCQLGQVLISMCRPDEAEINFQKALLIAPDSVEANLGLADALGDQGEVDKGLAIYEDQLSKTADRVGMLRRVGTYLLKIDRCDDAMQRLEEALLLKPDDLLVHGLLGDVAFKQGKREQAIEHYEAALRLRPDLTALRTRIALLKGELVAPPKK
jgi:tetratricopeptide (TPR) repeat protein